MDNPELSVGQLTPRTIYQYDNKTNIPWNMPEYTVPALHNDYKHIMAQKLYASQKKGVKTNDFYLTKRGYYMDYELKIAKGIPSSAVHQKQQPWDSTQTKLEGELLDKARSAIKYTIYQRMEMKQKRHPVPGVMTYSLEKSLTDIQKLLQKNQSKKITPGQKRYFHMNDSFLGEKVPGAGFYNPHDQVQKLHKSVGDWKIMTRKHEKWNKILDKRQSIKPAPPTYSPLHQQYKTFASLQKLDTRQKMKKNGFGSDSRFPYVRPNKKTILEERPAPCAYQTKVNWNGKNYNRNSPPPKKQWIKMIWKGSPPKVYN